MPQPYPAKKQAQNGHFGNRLIAFISNAYGGQLSLSR
jgi:hypothetical protein